MVVAGKLCLGTTALPGAAAASWCGQVLLQWLGVDILSSMGMQRGTRLPFQQK